MTSCQSHSNTTQYTRQVVNGFLYQLAVKVHGQGVLGQVVEWLYQGGPSVKAYFLSLGYSNEDYKRHFMKEQRILLEKGVSFKEFDFSLLYSMLQCMCGLAKDSDSVWISSSSGQTLEHLLYKIKQRQNDIFQTSRVQQMSDQELKKKLRKLMCLLSRILRFAGIRCGISPNVFREKVWEIKKYFQDILQKVREPLQVSDLNNLPQLQQEFKLLQDALLRKVLEHSQQELHELYPQLWDVTLIQWLYPDLKLQPSLNFTHLVIKEDMSSFPPSQQQSPRDVSQKDLLQTTCRDGRLPEVIIISGEGGMGKTTLLKHMLEMWVKDPSQIQGLQDIPLLLYVQLRDCTISSWKELLTHLLSNTFQESNLSLEFFAQLLQRLCVVVLLDGYDEVSKYSKNLIFDLMNYQQNMRIVITTRPVSLKELNYIVKNKRQALNIEIKGINRKHMHNFIEKTLIAVMDNSNHRERVKDKIMTNLKILNLGKDELYSPLTLTLITIREGEAPDQASRDIYGDLTSLMKAKIRERLILKGIDDAEEKIEEFYECQTKMALRGLKRHEHDLLSETVEELKAKCASLNIPYRELLSGFLISKKSRQGLCIVHIWSFPHNRFQEHWAADYIVTGLLRMSHTLPDMTGLQDLPLLTDIEEKKKAGIYGTPVEDNLVAFMFTKNPILQLYAEDIEKARELSWMNVPGDVSVLLMDILINITRILSLSQYKLLNRLAAAIISLILYSDHSHLIVKERCDIFCKIIMASEQSPGLLEASARAIKKYDKLKVYGESLAGFIPLIDYTKPSRVEVWIQKDMEDLPIKQLLTSLEDLAKQNIEINLITSYEKHSIEFSEACLQTVTTSECLSTLKKFCGDLTEVGMQLLPDSLTELQTISNGEGLQVLVTRLPYLQNLHTLCFTGQLSEAELRILPNVLSKLKITTNGEGLRALAERLPLLENLQDLDVELLDSPSPDFLLALPYEGKEFWIRFSTPPSPERMCQAVHRLCSTRRQQSRLIFFNKDDDYKEAILHELRSRGAKAFLASIVGVKFSFCDGVTD